MPETPTSPDLLPIIANADTPDIPRDMNNLANKTQEALNRRAPSDYVTVTGGQAGAPTPGTMVRVPMSAVLYESGGAFTLSGGALVAVRACAVQGSAKIVFEWQTGGDGTHCPIPIYAMHMNAGQTLSVSGRTDPNADPVKGRSFARIYLDEATIAVTATVPTNIPYPVVSLAGYISLSVIQYG